MFCLWRKEILFFKNCLNKTNKAAKLINSLQHLEGDLESLYSDQAMLMKKQFCSSKLFVRWKITYRIRDNEYFPFYSCKERESTPPTSSSLVLKSMSPTSKFSHPTKGIVYMDDRAQITMINPNILSTDAWVKHAAIFIATDENVFRANDKRKNMKQILPWMHSLDQGHLLRSPK